MFQNEHLSGINSKKILRLGAVFAASAISFAGVNSVLSENNSPSPVAPIVEETKAKTISETEEYKIYFPFVEYQEPPRYKGQGIALNYLIYANWVVARATWGYIYSSVAPLVPEKYGVEIYPMVRVWFPNDPIIGYYDWVMGYNEPDLRTPYGPAVTPEYGALVWRLDVEPAVAEDDNLLSPAPSHANRNWLPDFRNAYLIQSETYAKMSEEEKMEINKEVDTLQNRMTSLIKKQMDLGMIKETEVGKIVSNQNLSEIKATAKDYVDIEFEKLSIQMEMKRITDVHFPNLNVEGYVPAADATPPRMDAIAIHCYLSEQACEALVGQYVDYGKEWGLVDHPDGKPYPVWLTEFAFLNPLDLEKFLKWLDEHPLVERYAYYTNVLYGNEYWAPPPFPSMTLFFSDTFDIDNITNLPTVFGDIYASHSPTQTQTISTTLN